MAVNATSAFRLARTIIPGMVKTGWGRVINVASNAGLTGYAYTSAYCASKHAMVGLTRALAIELARTGVTVNAVCPGFVDTDMAATAIARIASKTKRTPEQARSATTRRTSSAPGSNRPLAVHERRPRAGPFLFREPVR